MNEYIDTAFKLIYNALFTTQTLITSSFFGYIIAILGAVPFAANFAEEWKSGVSKSVICRSGVKKYAISNIVVCALSSFVTITLGMMIFAVVLNGFAMPIEELDEYAAAQYLKIPYGKIIVAGYPFLYILARVTAFAAANSVAVVMGMTVSAFFPDKYIAVCSPLVFMSVIEIFSQMFASDDIATFYFNFTYLKNSWLPIYENPFLELLHTFTYFAVFIVIFGIVFVKAVERRVRVENS